MNISEDQLNHLQMFVKYCTNFPQVLHKPQFVFFKEFVQSFGGVIPPPEKYDEPQPDEEEAKEDVEMKSESEEAEMKSESEEESEEEEIPESDESEFEIDIKCLMECETEPTLPAVPYDENEEISEELWDKSSEKAAAANLAGKNGDWPTAVDLYSEAIILNPSQASLYAKRASALLYNSRPLAAIEDCNNALVINPDCRLAFKFRGRARRCIGQYQDSFDDLSLASKLDFDEETDEWLREISHSVHRIQQHKRKQVIRVEKRELEARRRRAAKARKEYEKHKKGNGASSSDFKENKEMPGMGNFADILKDPELMEAMKDPEVMAALIDMQKDPASLSKYKNNPKVQAMLAKFANKFGGPGATY